MIRSMTGFGRSSFEAGDTTFEVEARSVNHRHLDVRVRLPRLLSSYEPALRARAQARFARGKLDVSVATPSGAPPPARLDVDLAAAEQYIEAAERLRQRRVAGDLDVATLLGLPGVSRFEEPRLPAEEVEAALFAALDAALGALEAMRSAEGAALERELLARVEAVLALVAGIDERAEGVREAAVERLRKRTEQLRQETGLLDEARLHQEIVIAADRLDVTEELVRMRSHADQFRGIVGASDAANPVGRRLEFLLQEMGREANTIGSKVSDAPVAHLVVDLKGELERLREQVQNVE